MSTTEEGTRVRDEITGRGRKIYEEPLKASLEPEHTGYFVAIEPETGRYFSDVQVRTRCWLGARRCQRVSSILNA